jgi:3-oxoacyl-[acyl-carrier-protein] synthase II
MKRRVVVTGCGLVTPAGSTLDAFWQGVMSGRCLMSPVDGAAFGGMTGLMAATVPFDPADELPAELKEDAFRGRCLALALAAAQRAAADAGLPAALAERTGVVLGTTMGDERQVAALSDRWAAEGLAAVDAGFGTRNNHHRLPAAVARRHGLGGPVLLAEAACSSGNAAAALGYDLVASGEVDAMWVGGADTLTRTTFVGFSKMQALSKDICRPFDKRRDGVCFGEGAAFLVLEPLEEAQRRGARIRAELAGYGLSNDAHHITAPDPNGDGCARAMKQALETSGIPATAVDYVSPHGTGTPYNDLGETRALKAVLGEHARKVPISSLKSMIGHANGAASAIESVACVLAIEHQHVPPTANLTEPDPECDLDYVPVEGRSARVSTCLNLSAGFGGSNVCVILTRPP